MLTPKIQKQIKKCVMILSYALNALTNENNMSYTNDFCLISTDDTTQPLGFTENIVIRLGQNRIIQLLRVEGNWCIHADILEYSHSSHPNLKYTQVPLHPIQDKDWFCEIVNDALVELLDVIHDLPIHAIYFTLNTTMTELRINEQHLDDINIYRSIGLYNTPN